MYRKDAVESLLYTLKSPFDNKQSVKIGQNTIKMLLFENYHSFSVQEKSVLYNDCSINIQRQYFFASSLSLSWEIQREQNTPYT